MPPQVPLRSERSRAQREPRFPRDPSGFWDSLITPPFPQQIPKTAEPPASWALLLDGYLGRIHSDPLALPAPFPGTPTGLGQALVTNALKSRIPPSELNPSYEKREQGDKKESKSHLTAFKESKG